MTNRWSCSIAAGFVFIVFLAVLKVRSLRQETYTGICKSHLTEITVVIHNYNQKHGHLPPAAVFEDGGAMHSWRVLILEFWHPDLFARHRLSEPWNSTHNSLLASQIPHPYRCGLADSSLPEDQTTYVAMVGSNTVMQSSEYSPRRLEDVSTDAIMLIELPNKPRHWMAPMTPHLKRS
jgi:hypothetical protein